MCEKNNEALAHAPVNPLKSLTRAQFAALGGDAVAYLRLVSGATLSTMISETEFQDEVEYQLLMAADGTPLLVSDTEDAIVDWLGDKNLGLATLH